MTTTLDMSTTELREVNVTLQTAAKEQVNEPFVVTNPRGSHAMACGLDGPLNVTIKGATGYYTAGMNKEAVVTVEGSAGRAPEHRLDSSNDDDPRQDERSVEACSSHRGTATAAAGATAIGSLDPGRSIATNSPRSSDERVRKVTKRGNSSMPALGSSSIPHKGSTRFGSIE